MDRSLEIALLESKSVVINVFRPMTKILENIAFSIAIEKPFLFHWICYTLYKGFSQYCFHYEVYWIKILQILFGIKGVNYQRPGLAYCLEFCKASKDQVALYPKYLDAQTLSFIWEGNWAFIRRSLKRLMRRSSTESCSLAEWSGLLRLESLFIICYDHFLYCMMKYYRSLSQVVVFSCLKHQCHLYTFNQFQSNTFFLDCLCLYTSCLVTKTLSFLLWSSNFLIHVIRRLCCSSLLSGVSKSEWEPIECRNIRGCCTRKVKPPVVPLLNLSRLRFPLTAYGVLAPGENRACEQLNLEIPYPNNFTYLCSPNRITEMKTIQMPTLSSEKGDKVKDDLILWCSILLFGALVRFSTQMLPCVERSSESTSRFHSFCDCLFRQLSIIFACLAASLQRISPKMCHHIGMLVRRLFGSLGWHFFICLAPPSILEEIREKLIIQQRIGSGGSSSVYLVELLSKTHAVAKVLSIPTLPSRITERLIDHVYLMKPHTVTLLKFSDYVAQNDFHGLDEWARSLFHVWFEMATYFRLWNCKLTTKPVSPPLLHVGISCLPLSCTSQSQGSARHHILLPIPHSSKQSLHTLPSYEPQKTLWIVTPHYHMNLLEWRKTLFETQMSPTLRSCSPFWIVLRIFKALVKQVCCLHTLGIPHGDLKCQNILVKQYGFEKLRVVISDYSHTVWSTRQTLEEFKCFRLYESIHMPLTDRTLYQDNTTRWCDLPGVLGSDAETTLLLSPERLGLFHSITRMAQDVWALGCLFFELLTGVMLFDFDAQEQRHFGHISHGLVQYSRILHFLLTHSECLISDSAHTTLFENLKKMLRGYSDSFIHLMLNQIQGILHYCLKCDPQKRPTCHQLYNHLTQKLKSWTHLKKSFI